MPTRTLAKELDFLNHIIGLRFSTKTTMLATGILCDSVIFSICNRKTVIALKIPSNALQIRTKYCDKSVLIFQTDISDLRLKLKLHYLPDCLV